MFLFRRDDVPVSARIQYDAVPASESMSEPSSTTVTADPVLRSVRHVLVIVLLLVVLLVGLLATGIQLRRTATAAVFPLPLRVGDPVLSRNVYLITCPGQSEMERYATLFATISVWADVIVYCWREDCSIPAALLSSSSAASSSSSSDTATAATAGSGELAYQSSGATLVSPWPTMSHRFVRMRNGDIRSIDRFSTKLVVDSYHATRTPSPPASRTSSLSPTVHYYPVHSRFELINQRQLKRNLTWTGSRNHLFSRVQQLQSLQGWQWAYVTYLDGDVHPACDKLKVRLANVTDYNVVIPGTPQASYMKQFNHALTLRPEVLSNVINITKQHYSSSQASKKGVAQDTSVISSIPEEACWVMYDSFLLSAAPAMASISNHLSKSGNPDFYAEVAYHLDAMVASFHVDAAGILLPYCERFDSRSWWSSQAYLVTRSVCMIGHALQFDELYMSGAEQTHGDYPKRGSAWNPVKPLIPYIVPADLQYFTRWLGKQRSIAPISLQHYSGFTLDAVHPECLNRSIDAKTCLPFSTLPTLHSSEGDGT